MAGQILYVQVPRIDYIWHPFSLASSSADNEVHLHIGIIGEFKDKNRRGEWTQVSQGRCGAASVRVRAGKRRTAWVGCSWVVPPPRLPRHRIMRMFAGAYQQDKSMATWTYRLLQLFRKSTEQTANSGKPANIDVKVCRRGDAACLFGRMVAHAVVLGCGDALPAAWALRQPVYQVLRPKIQRRGGHRCGHRPHVGALGSQGDGAAPPQGRECVGAPPLPLLLKAHLTCAAGAGQRQATNLSGLSGLADMWRT